MVLINQLLIHKCVQVQFSENCVLMHIVVPATDNSKLL